IGEFRDEAVGVVDAGLGLGGAGLGAAAQPFLFDADAVFKRLLMAGLRVEKFLFGFEELTVVAAGAEHSVGIGAVQLGHLRGGVFEEVAVVADEDGGEGLRRKQ